MTLMNVCARLVLALLLAGPTAVALDAAQPPASSQEAFVPVDQLPTEEQIPAAPLVAGAYGIAWAAVLMYLWSVWRRLGRVERELAEATRRMESRPGR